MIYKWGSSIAMFDFQRVVGHLGKSPQVVAATFCNHQAVQEAPRQAAFIQLDVKNHPYMFFLLNAST